MTRWTRVTRATYCGRCSELQPVGAPMLELQIPKLRKPLLRCDKCAGPAPPDLPTVIVETERPTRLPTMLRLGLLPLDEREPGEEG